LIIGALTAIFWDGTCHYWRIPSGIPNLQIPGTIPEAYTLIVKYAAVLAVLGSIDSLLTSVIADNDENTA
jgi:SulP family sulfate permease